MSTHVIYQSPKKEKHKSAPIPVTDERARKLLEGKGWRVVERLDLDPVPFEDAESLPVDTNTEDDLTHVWTLADVTELNAEQRTALEAAGFGTEEALREATDEQLRAVEGVGPASVRNIRKALAPVE